MKLFVCLFECLFVCLFVCYSVNRFTTSQHKEYRVLYTHTHTAFMFGFGTHMAYIHRLSFYVNDVMMVKYH